MATALLGDSLATNIFLLGYAYQLGMIPVGSVALRKAIELNGAAVESNQRAFEWGRLACHDPDEVERQSRTDQGDLPSDRRIATDLGETIARRVEFLTAYQDSALAQRYKALVDRARDIEARVGGGGEPLSDAVARNYFKLLAIKDEYEVARLYTDGEFERQVAAAFEGDYTLRYHFAPPLWVKPDKITGVPVKRTYGTWIRPALRVLATLRRIRGTLIDPFGYMDERRVERQLIVEYERLFAEIERSVRPDTFSLAVELLGLPSTIRGYGHVKQKSLAAAKAREAVVLGKLREPPVGAQPLAA